VCSVCKQRFTTMEQVAPPQLRVEKRDGRTEPYDRSKLLRALKQVAKHRPLDDDALEGLVERIETDLQRGGIRHVRWSRIVELTLDALRAVDRVAEQRLAANYIDDTGALRFEEAAPAAVRPQLPLFSEDD
jgi:transcriptional repressor NrdR